MRLTLILFIFSMLIACKNQSDNISLSTTSDTNTLYDEVMAIHDEVMPEMATLHRLKKQLEAATTPENTEITGAKIKLLNDADDAMMSWMAMFKMPNDAGQKSSYLTSEKIKITEVRDQMYKAMEEAKNALDSLKI